VTHVLSITIDVTSQALGQARLEETQQRALSALATIARHLTSAGQAPSFFDELSATIAELVSAERVAFWLYDPDEETISAQPGHFGFGVDDVRLASHRCCRPGGTDPLARVIFDDLIVVKGSDVAVPWKAGDNCLGALGAYDSTRASGFTDEDVRALQAAATAAALVWQHPLRAYDALQLGSALRLSRATRLAMTFLCSDAKLCRAASEEGLRVQRVG